MLIGRRRFLPKFLVLLVFIFFLVTIINFFIPYSEEVVDTKHHNSFGERKFLEVVKKKSQLNILYEKQIEEDEKKQIRGLGNNGRAVHLVGEEAERANEIMRKEAFNLVLSDKLMYNRTVQDARHPDCQKVDYDFSLPSASVIIIFNNERWSSLIRTVWSVIINSPSKHLKEVILIDDKSDHEELHGKLDYYIKTRFPENLVKLYRCEKRSGLVKARLEGAKRARGDVMVFLDAHCEVGPVWLEPLLQRIKDERKAVVVPIIDVIDDKTFEYQHNQGSFMFQVGGFTWSGHFTWVDVSPDEIKRKGSPIAPTRSPTMAGGLFAIDRNYFWEIGAYDQEMDVWGGENLEMSFRIWQCGGYLETIPCSRVGHIFRDFHPYTFPGRKDTHGINTARGVNVWMGDYKRFFYLHRPDLKEIDIGDISDRIKLKQRLNCKDFGWYLKNIYKEKFIPDENVQAYGRVGTTSNNLCLDLLQRSEDSLHELGVYSCHSELFPSQYYSFSNKGELRREFVCAQIATDNKVVMNKCDDASHQKWKLMKNGNIRHLDSGKCMDTTGLTNQGTVFVSECTNEPTKVWQWEFVRTNMAKPKQTS